MKHLIAFFAPYLIYIISVAQEQPAVIVGKIVSQASGIPLHGVIITTIPGGLKTVSSIDGEFSIKPMRGDSALSFSHIAYLPKRIALKTPVQESISVVLEEKTTLLEEVTISSKPAVFFGMQKYWVFDYEFWNHLVLLIVFKEKIESSELLILDSTHSLLQSIPMPETPSGFFRDCLNNVHVLGTANAMQIAMHKLSDSLYFELLLCPLAVFNKQLRPFTAKVDIHFFARTYGEAALTAYFYHYNASVRKLRIMTIVEDAVRIEMLGDEGDRLQRLSSLMDAEMGSPAIAMLLRHGPSFSENVIYKHPVSAHITTIKDSVYLFDFCNLRMTVFSGSGDSIRSVTLEPGNAKTWTRQLIKDEALQEIYTSYEQGGYTSLKKVDLVSGAFLPVATIETQYVSRIKVNDGFAYFIYRPKESIQTKYLYRVKVCGK